MKATGQLTPNGFLVLAGSQAVLAERPSAQKYPWALNMRQKLKAEGSLVVESEFLRFGREVEFSSPREALVNEGLTRPQRRNLMADEF